jgi:hypothetical protein
MTSTDRVDELAGRDVLTVGRRQAWLSVAFGVPTEARDERTLWIDSPWRVEPGGSGQATLADLEPLVTLHVDEVDLGTEELSIRFDDGRRLVVVNAPAEGDSDGWWLGSADGWSSAPVCATTGAPSD